MCCITGLDRCVSLTALGCKSISNRGDERAFCLFRFSIKRISCLQLFPSPFKIMLREQANLPALYPQGKNVQCKFVVYFLFEGGGGGGAFFFPPFLFSFKPFPPPPGGPPFFFPFFF